jgi:hypothetical protein
MGGGGGVEVHNEIYYVPLGEGGEGNRVFYTIVHKS